MNGSESFSPHAHELIHTPFLISGRSSVGIMLYLTATLAVLTLDSKIVCAKVSFLPSLFEIKG